MKTCTVFQLNHAMKCVNISVIMFSFYTLVVGFAVKPLNFSCPYFAILADELNFSKIKRCPVIKIYLCDIRND